MARMHRRECLLLGALVGTRAAAEPDAPDPSVTCFYQFGKQALDVLGGLPSGPGYLHILSHSHPGMRPHPETARSVRALGSSFRYALALDIHKYTGWQTADDGQLRAWATAFREQALHADGPADYFAFNEMPTTGAANPALRGQVSRLLRHLREAGGGPKLPGVFYFTERNLNPRHWQGDSDDFWLALDETCDLVVGEHYHSDGFTFARSVDQLAEHLFALPRWLRESGKPAQVRIAARKYAVLHSSYYGPAVTGWAGLRNDLKDEAALDRYFRHLTAATRHSEFGRRRIAFGPLATQNLDPRVHAVLAKVLREDLSA